MRELDYNTEKRENEVTFAILMRLSEEAQGKSFNEIIAFLKRNNIPMSDAVKELDKIINK